jgi:flagellum-specific peptidoglycan hydrolase FlgJ
MKEMLIRKLSSRKFWALIAALAAACLLAFGADADRIEKIVGIISAISACAVYIFAEGKVDEAHVGATENAVTTPFAGSHSITETYFPPEVISPAEAKFAPEISTAPAAISLTGSPTAAQAAFIASVAGTAVNEWFRGGILPSLTISQAILESGWGLSGLAQKANALFGIKANGWTGKVINYKTWEVLDGKRTDITDAFRAYNSWEESIKDHTNFLTGLPRYSKVVGETDYKRACYAIHAAGYATAPNYAEALINLIERYGLYQYDKVCDPLTAGGKTYVVQQGDSFWKIALQKLGSGDRYAELAAFNGLSPESLIVPGQVLKLPQKQDIT